MREYTELYPLVCVGRIFAYPSYGGPQDRRRRAFDIHSGYQSSRLVARVRRVHKGHRDTCTAATPVKRFQTALVP